MRLTTNERDALIAAKKDDASLENSSSVRPRKHRIARMAYCIAYPFDREAMFDSRVGQVLRWPGTLGGRFKRLLRLRELRRKGCEAVRW